jgi:hypothetical protein
VNLGLPKINIFNLVTHHLVCKITVHRIASRSFSGSQFVGDLASVFASHVRRHVLKGQIIDTIAGRLDKSSAALSDLRVVE